MDLSVCLSDFDLHGDLSALDAAAAALDIMRLENVSSSSSVF